MSVVAKLLSRFRAKPIHLVKAHPYSDAEFLDAAMRVARDRTEADQTARKELAAPKLVD